MDEAETRAEHVDPALKAAGWGVVEGSKVLREYPITLGRLEGVGGKRGKGLCADYVLVYRNRKLAVIEAKGWDEELTLGVGQAKNYAGKMELRFAYSTNGQGLYGIDMGTGKEGECPYPTPDELWAKTFPSTAPGANAAEAWRDRFSAIPFPDKSGTWSIRFYHRAAGDFSVAMLQQQCPGVGVDLIRRVLKDLQADGQVECLGRGRSASWRKTACWRKEIG